MAWYVSDPPDAQASRCTWAQTTAGTAYQRVHDVESYLHQARAASTWLGDASYGAYSGRRAHEILENAIYYKDGYTDKPRYALDVRHAIANVREAGSTIMATAPSGGGCTYVASQSAISDSRDSGDSAVTHTGRHIEIDTSGWAAGTWNVRITCGSARQATTIEK